VTSEADSTGAEDSFRWGPELSALPRVEVVLILGIPIAIALSAVAAIILSNVPADRSDFDATATGASASLLFYAVILFCLGVKANSSRKRSRFGPASIFAAVYWIFVLFSFFVTMTSGGFAGPRDVTIAALLVIDVFLGLLWAILVVRRSLLDDAWRRDA
jgi:hypothetical protein